MKDVKLNNIHFLNSALDEIIYAIGNYDQSVYCGLWLSLFGVDRDLPEEEVSIQINGRLFSNKKEIDDLIEERIYKLKDLIYKSNRAFDGEMIVLAEE